MLKLQGAQFRSLVGEQRSHMLHGVAKKNKNYTKKKKNPDLYTQWNCPWRNPSIAEIICPVHKESSSQLCIHPLDLILCLSSICLFLSRGLYNKAIIELIRTVFWMSSVIHSETEQDPGRGSGGRYQARTPFCPLLLVDKTPASMTFPEFQRAGLLIKGGAVMKLPEARLKGPEKLAKNKILTA